MYISFKLAATMNSAKIIGLDRLSDHDPVIYISKRYS